MSKKVFNLEIKSPIGNKVGNNPRLIKIYLCFNITFEPVTFQISNQKLESNLCLVFDQYEIES
jgi:hypothetical protein